MADEKVKYQWNELGIEPRDLTVCQRRELFLKKKKEMSKDWRVLQGSQPPEELMPVPIGSLV
jgi:hypothetical protein